MTVAAAAGDAIRHSYAWAFEELADRDPLKMFYWVLNAWGMAVFWGIGGLYLALDVLAPAWALRYKIQPEENAPVDSGRLAQALKRIAFNQFVVASAFSVVWGWLAIRVRGNPYLPEDISFAPMLLARDVLVIAACEEIGFFYTHKWNHDFAFLYKHVHKIHHEWKAPIAIAAVYAHPIEHVMCNLGPIALGPLVCGCHVWLIFVWIFVALTSTLVSHSGYHLPFLASPEKHDFHHKYFDVNYGPLGVLDRLYGTDAKFRKHVAYDRHRTVYSLTPIRELVPDRPAGGPKSK